VFATYKLDYDNAFISARESPVGVKMTLTEKIEGALPSQEMRQAFFHEGWTDLKLTEKREERIQPASYEPGIEDRCWRVPDGFYPEPGVSVIESLRRLNPRERPEFKVTEENGIVAFQNHSLLFPLEGNWKVPQNFFVNASPKSTEGRMFNFARVIADGIPGYDSIQGPFEGKMYVLLKPLAFNNHVFPDFTFVQLRAYCRNQCVLSDAQLLRLIHQHNLVRHNGVPLPLDDIKVNNGLVLTADVEGKESDGVIGFKTRRNPEPIDRRVIGKIPWENYFDALLAPRDGKYDLKHGDFVLAQSWEWLKMTPTHAGVMDASRLEMMENRAHMAGYFDGNEFEGIATLEIPVIDAMSLWHRKLLCAVKYEEMRAIPDKEYHGAHQGQRFALIPKPMTRPDSAEIAGKTASEKEFIMYVDRATLFGKDHFDGFRLVNGADFRRRVLDNYNFGIKGSAELGKGLEADNSRKQPIAYTVFVDPVKKDIFAYQRASEKKNYSETRLFGNWSIGVGGHIRPSDKTDDPTDIVLASLHREVHREEVTHEGKRSEPSLIGYINADNARQVDSVHFGLLYVIEMNGTVRPKDAELRTGRMMPIAEFRRMMSDPQYEVEVWSKIAFAEIEKRYG